MIALDMLQLIPQQIAQSVDISALQDGRIAISLPMANDDGDYCTCYAAFNGQDWELRDYGDVAMRASYRDVNLLSKGYRARFAQTAEFYGFETGQAGELVAKTENGDIGRAVFTFAQLCLAMQHLAKSKPEKPMRDNLRLSTEVGEVLSRKFGDKIVQSNWHDATRDPHSVYQVDFRVESGELPWFFFAAGGSQSCLRAACTIQHYRREKLKFRGIAVCREEEKLQPIAKIPLREVVDEWVPRFEQLEEIIDLRIAPQA